MSNYAIDIYLSDETANVINYNYNNTLLQEPTLKAKITYNLLPQSEKDKLTFDATDDSSLDASKVSTSVRYSLRRQQRYNCLLKKISSDFAMLLV